MLDLFRDDNSSESDSNSDHRNSYVSVNIGALEQNKIRRRTVKKRERGQNHQQTKSNQLFIGEKVSKFLPPSPAKIGILSKALDVLGFQATGILSVMTTVINVIVLTSVAVVVAFGVVTYIQSGITISNDGSVAVGDVALNSPVNNSNITTLRMALSEISNTRITLNSVQNQLFSTLNTIANLPVGNMNSSSSTLENISMIRQNISEVLDRIGLQETKLVSQQLQIDHLRNWLRNIDSNVTHTQMVVSTHENAISHIEMALDQISRDHSDSALIQAEVIYSLGQAKAYVEILLQNSTIHSLQIDHLSSVNALLLANNTGQQQQITALQGQVATLISSSTFGWVGTLNGGALNYADTRLRATSHTVCNILNNSGGGAVSITNRAVGSVRVRAALSGDNTKQVICISIV